MSDFNNWNQAIIDEFRANSGKVGGYFAGNTLLILHTVGAKSGKEHINPVVYVKDGDRLVIIASKAGAPTNPDLYYNIRAHPLITVEVGTEQFQTQAEIVSEPERTRLYNKFVEVAPGFAEYQKKTTRVIPVIALTSVRLVPISGACRTAETAETRLCCRGLWAKNSGPGRLRWLRDTPITLRRHVARFHS